MPKDGRKTKTRILKDTKDLVLEKGFSGTSIDNILERTELTKGAFFYHFKSKADLAHHLMEYFIQSDKKELDLGLEKTLNLTDKPYLRLLSFVQHFIDIMSNIEDPPSCLYASYLYEPEQFSDEIKVLVGDAMLMWRTAITDLIQSVNKEMKMKSKVSVEALADMFTVIIEGGYLLSKAVNDPKITAEQLKLYKSYLEMLYGK